MTLPEYAAQKRVSTKTVWRWIKSGKLKAKKVRGIGRGGKRYEIKTTKESA